MPPLDFRRAFRPTVLVASLLALAACTSGSKDASTGFQDTFPVARTALANTGTSRYFVLEPGYRLTYKHGNATLVVTVLNETKLVDGVQTRVIEEREVEAGQLTEISRNYFALDPATGDVYYFGEDVDMYKEGKVTGHGGSWLSGIDGAHFGLMMPGTPKAGQKFQHEVAPDVAMDRAEATSVSAVVKTPAGEFTNCVEIAETSPLEKGTGHKAYAPGVGMVRDDEYVLVKIERP